MARGGWSNREARDARLSRNLRELETYAVDGGGAADGAGVRGFGGLLPRGVTGHGVGVGRRDVDDGWGTQAGGGAAAGVGGDDVDDGCGEICLVSVSAPVSVPPSDEGLVGVAPVLCGLSSHGAHDGADEGQGRNADPGCQGLTGHSGI